MERLATQVIPEAKISIEHELEGTGRSSMQMFFNRLACVLNKSEPVTRIANKVGGIILFLMIVVTFVDVFARYVFSAPLPGRTEATEIGMVILVYFAVAYTYLQGGHVSIDMVVNYLPKTGKKIAIAVSSLLAIGVLLLVSWQSIEYALRVRATGLVAPVLGIPIFPWVFFVSAGCMLFLVLVARDFLNNLAAIAAARKGVLFGFALVFTLGVLALYAFQSHLWSLGPVGIAALGVFVFLLLSLSGIPIAFSLLIVGFIGLVQLGGLQVAYKIIGTYPFRNTFSYDWAVLPFFIAMGYFVLQSGLGHDLYRAAYVWVGHFPGGLAVATNFSCAAFGACVGDTMSSIGTLSAVALPEMEKHKYSRSLSSGSIAASSTLGAMIPPSIIMVIYGMITEVSIGSLFVAGILPGILIAAVFGVYICVRCWLKPADGPAGERSNFTDKMNELKKVWPVLSLFIMVIGGLYVGLCTPIEAGAFGAGGALLIGLLMRRFTWQKIVSALMESGKLTAMIMFVLAAAQVFGYFLALSGFGAATVEFVGNLNVPPIVTVLIFLSILFACGTVIPYIPTILIVIPLAFPIVVTQLGYDAVWFGIMITLLLDLSTLTPPFCLNVWLMQGVSGYPVNTIIRGVIPFIILEIIVGGILILFPEIATFLPSIIE